MSEKVFIFDTTLRDGEQSPGCSMNLEEKLKMAAALQRLGVDIIEAGFPNASEGDFEAVSAIAKYVQGCAVAGLARANFPDIDRCWEAVQHADNPRIHTFIATSDIHLEKKLKMSRDEVFEQAVSAVAHAKAYTDNVEFSCEDATRSDRDYICRVVEAVIEAGATTVNIPDTVGYTTPHEFTELIGYIREKVPNIERAVISVHCHNDLGLAVANSLAAVKAGARQVECTVNGIGERAGNASMEEIVMAMKIRAGNFGDVHTDINTKQIYAASRSLSGITGMLVQANKAIVGDNAFAHEAGIHQDGVLKSAITYEIMTPESVGVATNKLVLGKHSGRHAFKDRLAELGFALEGEELNIAFRRFKSLADKKKDVYDEDLIAVVTDSLVGTGGARYRLESINIACGTNMTPFATVRLEIDGEVQEAAGRGDGPVDAIFRTIRELTQAKAELLKYVVSAVTEGTDALGEVTVRLRQDGITVLGHGAHTDVLVSSANAYVDALNRIEAVINAPARIHPQQAIEGV